MSLFETPDQTNQETLPQSPKRLCEINFTTIAEDAENLQMSPDRYKRRQRIRLEWLKIISKSQKLQQMQTTFNFLRYVNIDSELNKFRTKLLIRRWHRQLLKRKWQMMANGLNHEDYIERFNERTRRVCEVRAKQASEFLINQFCVEPEFDSIIKTVTNINPVSNLNGKYLNSLREQREAEDELKAELERKKRRRQEEEEEEEEVYIEREVLPEPQPPQNSSRKWIIAFVVSAVIGIILGIILFWKKNEKVISFLRNLSKDAKNQTETLQKNPFGDIPKPKQTVDPSLDTKSKRKFF